ncbi:hypothetical protein EFS28_03275 [Lactobacillus acidophilus]|uniref:hypothetical protein n=1 Tax=Lactobacillus acidophilus TaxID=1579 RepID=UPI00288C51C6|nr:hypothetical protein [Lactobacillus acidophilus]MCT3602812.1 hypothetical protein [Lactobacillus acidophilus]MCT3623272.1 hypothetical protein [Lactobacillus acidophilus]
MDVNKLDNFEEVRNTLQMIEEMLNRMPLEHGGQNDVFAVTAEDMDNLLSNVTPDMNSSDVATKAKEILHTCRKVLELRKKENRLTPEQQSLLENIEKLG